MKYNPALTIEPTANDSRVRWIRDIYEWRKLSDKDALRLWGALLLVKSGDEMARRALLRHIAEELILKKTPGDVDKAIAILVDHIVFSPPPPLPVVHVVYYDPYDKAEEEYVTQCWVETGKSAERIATLYERMRYWREHSDELSHGCPDSPFDRKYPDMSWASIYAGLTDLGCIIVRNIQQDYRNQTVEAVQP